MWKFIYLVLNVFSEDNQQWVSLSPMKANYLAIRRMKNSPTLSTNHKVHPQPRQEEMLPNVDRSLADPSAT